MQAGSSQARADLAPATLGTCTGSGARTLVPTPRSWKQRPGEALGGE